MMKQETYKKVVEALVEKVERLETDVFFKDRELETLKEKLQEAENTINHLRAEKAGVVCGRKIGVEE